VAKQASEAIQGLEQVGEIYFYIILHGDARLNAEYGA
jgi:hypothetical protein